MDTFTTPVPGIAPALHATATMVAQGAFDECEGDHDLAMDLLYEHTDGMDLVIYHHKAVQCCATWDTSEGEAWCEDAGGIAQEGDTFGQIASRIAFATILVAAQDRLNDLIEAAECVADTAGEEA